MAATATSAPASENPPQGYGAAIDRAVDEHRRGHFEEAREHFREAHELFPNARTLRGLGKVEFELRNYGESIRHLTAALASGARPLDDELRAEVKSLLERARAYVGEVHVEVQPGTATVSVDGVTVATGPEAEFELLVGDHVLEFRANGRVPEQRQVRVRGRDHVHVQVALGSPDAEATSIRFGRRETRPGPTPMRKRWWLWTAVGAALAGTATAIALSSTRGGDGDGHRAAGPGVVLRNP